MADLTDFQEDAVEMISSDAEAPTAVVQMGEDGGANMLLNDGKFAARGPNPQFDLLAAYALHLANENDITVPEVFDAIDERLELWSESGGIQIGQEKR
ncbi:hypothetical protein [Halobacterium rubrum]|jgi:hypothetical protein|uniref:hypothetical protein n=1 Tax=Halobacterium TaxID=2239 RepID=UPI001F28911A|nr:MULTISPECIES: hypothetical protein [Halobacterium]MDH5018876.1 hypothetical protein [Halobacterium rubrum]